MSKNIKYEITDEPFPNCIRGWYVRYVDPIERFEGKRNTIRDFGKYPVQIDFELPRSIISTDLVKLTMPNGHAILSPKPLLSCFDPSATLEPRPKEGEIILDLVIPVDDIGPVVALDLPLIVDRNASIPLRIGQEILSRLNLSFETIEIDGVEKHFLIVDRI